VLALLGAIAPNTKTLAEVATFDPHDAEFQAFATLYEVTLQKAADNNGHITKNDAHHLRESFVAWVQSLGQADVANRIGLGLHAWIELNIP